MNITNNTGSLSSGALENDWFYLKFDTNNLLYFMMGFSFGMLLTTCVFVVCLKLRKRRQKREELV